MKLWLFLILLPLPAVMLGLICAVFPSYWPALVVVSVPIGGSWGYVMARLVHKLS